MSGAYIKCDCCGKIQPVEEIETITVKIKKCKNSNCTLDIDSVVKTRPEMKTLGAMPLRPVYTKPASIAEVTGRPPEEEGVPLKK